MNLEDLRPALAYSNFTVRQLAILLVVYANNKPIYLKDLAAHLKIARPAVCRAWDALCEIGLMKRIRDEDDRRNVYVQLTDKGREFALKVSL